MAASVIDAAIFLLIERSSVAAANQFAFAALLRCKEACG